MNSNTQKSAIEEFQLECQNRIASYANNEKLKSTAHEFLKQSAANKYAYNFAWLGRPIIQYPADIVAMQEIIFTVQPDLIIETGIAHGGSLIFSASMLALLNLCYPNQTATNKRKVLGIDIDIREHNKQAIMQHPMYKDLKMIEMIQGSSIADEVVSQVKNFVKNGNYQKVLIFLDSMHTHDHVLAELHAYSPLVSSGSYCIVFDTLIENMPKDYYPDRPWNVGNNPMTAVKEFLKTDEGKKFEIKPEIFNKLLVSVAENGFLYKK